ncbi:MAG: hypothetical protein JW953_20715 [Anaerolineae bacterium]|nr:hypothetical protein [Anaerolineae bacterium]
MDSGMLREEVVTRVQRLSIEDLKIVNAFIAFLEAGAKDSVESEKNLSKADQIVIESFKQSWLEAQNGQIRPIEELEWN